MKILPIVVLVALCAVAAVRPAMQQKKEAPQPAQVVEKQADAKMAALLEAAFAPKGLFEKFLREFDNTQLPYGISLNQMKKEIEEIAKARETGGEVEKEGKALSSKYVSFLPQIREGRFSRMGPEELVPEVAFPVGEAMMAVIYCKRMGFRSYAHYEMATFNNNGKLVAIHELGYSNFYDQIATFHIDNEQVICQKNFTVKWAKDLDEHGVDGNSITGYELEKTEFFKIKSNGEVEQLENYATEDVAAKN